MEISRKIRDLYCILLKLDIGQRFRDIFTDKFPWETEIHCILFGLQTIITSKKNLTWTNQKCENNISELI